MDAENIELEDVMKRMEACVKGTLLVDGEKIIRTSFDNTTSTGLVQHLDVLKRACENFVREISTVDKLDYVRVDYKERATRNSQQIMMAIEDDFKAIVVQEYKVRDLRVRSINEHKDSRGYKYIQKNYFYPTLDK